MHRNYKKKQKEQIILNNPDKTNINTETDINIETDIDIENQYGNLSPYKIQNHIELINFNNSINLDVDKEYSNEYWEDKYNHPIKKSKSYPNEILTSDIDIKCFNRKKNVNSNYNIQNNHIISPIQLNNLNQKDRTNSFDLDESNCETNLITNKSYMNVAMGFCNRLRYWINSINKPELVNKLLSIILHIFIMIVFEIYFYFNYVVWIEKEEFLNQIQNYLAQLNLLTLNPAQREIVKLIISNGGSNTELFMDYLYTQYINSLEKQKKILYDLLVKACVMGGYVGLTLLILFNVGIYYRKKIKWNWIWIENLLMFLLLGVFEYFFFINIIMKYSPITDAEIKYYIASEIFNHFNSTR